MEKEKRKTDIYLIIIFIILACIFFINVSWFCNNEIFLIYDSGDFRMNSVLLYNKLINNNLSSIKDYNYYQHITKEQLTTLSIIPFYVIFGVNNNKIPPLFGGYLFFLLFILGSYLIGKEIYGKKISFFACLLLLCSKRLFFASRLFYNDLTVAAMVIWCYYFFIKSDFFSSKRYTYLFILFFGLGLLSKPTFLIIVPCIISFLILQFIFNKKEFYVKIIRIKIQNLMHIIIASLIFLPVPLMLFKRIFSHTLLQSKCFSITENIFTPLFFYQTPSYFFSDLTNKFGKFILFFNNQFESVILKFLSILSIIFIIHYFRKKHVPTLAAIISFNFVYLFLALIFKGIFCDAFENPPLFRLSYSIIPFYNLCISFLVFKILKCKNVKKGVSIFVMFFIISILFLSVYTNNKSLNSPIVRLDAQWDDKTTEIRLNYQEIVNRIIVENQGKVISILLNDMLFYKSFTKEPFITINDNKVFPQEIYNPHFMDAYVMEEYKNKFIELHFNGVYNQGKEDKYTNIALKSDFIILKTTPDFNEVISEFYIPFSKREKYAEYYNGTSVEEIINNEYTKVLHVIKKNQNSFRCIYNLSLDDGNFFIIYEKANIVE